MLIPLRTDSPLRATPWANWALIGANIIIYAITVHYPALAARYTLYPSSPKLLNYFTYQFIHANLPHVLFNMLFLYVFGNNVNDRMGNIGYLAFYLAGGIFAGIGYMLLMPQPIVGASGAIAAVTGAYLVLLPRSHVTIIYFVLLIGVAEIPSIWLILGYYVLQDIVLQVVHSQGGAADNVAHIAHLSGTFFGFSVCLFMLLTHLMPRDQFDIVALMRRWNNRRQYRTMVRQGYDPFARQPVADFQPDPNAGRIQDLKAAIGEALASHDSPEAARLFANLQELDPTQSLSKQNQLDVANQLYSDGHYRQAAGAYELLIRHYPKLENLEHIRLILGLLYSRYLAKPDAAREQLHLALQTLHTDRDRAMALEELQRLGPPPPPINPSIV
ncbi:MAG: rhomboid family intramembrane serine protease [Phycisphaerae bacterium]|nr:rhomboid family intramembrane serine protease [Phycisphaerae bacterium]